MRIMHKPHIFWSSFDHKWACVLPYVGIVESGDSPKEAYDRYRREELVKEMVEKLLDKRSHAVLKRFDSYATGNHSTIMEW